ncbi:MAG TPA: redoxin domain-containing protein [Bryobacteraceae bacterium]|nr:redoxin domain-containing protein [Bryobacteraceae bacterium]HPT25076.1 redoxin domain-containing protein [Bryobacteraceae bacterium]
MREMHAPEIAASAWLNTPEPLRLEQLKGRVVALYAFQPRCQGCLQEALPQAKGLWRDYPRADLEVIGLHCPFESASRLDRDALEAMLAENGIEFPVAMDAEGTSWQPETFSRYSMQGTPTLVLIARNGKRRLQRVGYISDEDVRAAIEPLIGEQG